MFSYTEPKEEDFVVDVREMEQYFEDPVVKDEEIMIDSVRVKVPTLSRKPTIFEIAA